MHKQRGFTLIELMVVVVIIGILAAVAYPAFTDHVRKGRRAEARAALMSLLQQQERYMTQQNTYLAFSPGSSTAVFSQDITSTTKHDIGAQQCQAVGSVTPAVRDCIEVYAQPKTGYSDPGITLMAIDTQGRRRCTGTRTDQCWK